MGLFDIPMVFKNREEIRKALLKIQTLDYKERPKVYEALVEQLDNGGVTKREFREVILDLRKSFDISEIDARHLKDLLEEK